MEYQKKSVLWGKRIFTSSQCPNCGGDMQLGQCNECWYKDPSRVAHHKTSRGRPRRHNYSLH